MGKIGVGKSSTGNMLLGRKSFKARRKSESVTKHTKSRRGTIHDRSVLVIDTPGLYSTSKENSRQHVKEEIKNCIQIGAPGIHAIIFVLSAVTRFTEEDKTCFEDFFAIFGEMFYMYAVVIFTGTDILNEDKLDLQKYIGSDIVLKSFLQKCGNRYVGFNNKNPTPLEAETQRNHLISKVVELNELLKTYYTNQYFQEAEKKLQEMEAKKSGELEELREQIDGLQEQFQIQNDIQMTEIENLYHGKLIVIRDEIRQQLEQENKKEKKEKKVERW